MITCETFRTSLRPGTDDPSLLEHLRQCDGCLDFAVGVDPDYFFRSIGGSEMTPPGGVDAFVGDVMRQVHMRRTETSIAPPHTLTWRQRLAIAATVAAGVTGAMVVYRHDVVTPAPQPVARIAKAAPAPAKPVALTTKPIIERYDSKNATIIEVPTDGSASVVMIFDDKLPADL